MTKPQIVPYGSWESPITSDLIVAESVRLGEIALDGDDTYWIEGRPAEQGRNVLVRRTPDGTVADLTPPGFNVRTRVHEYGGGAFTVSKGTVFWTNFDDQHLYRQESGQPPRPVIETTGIRCAEAVIDPLRGLLFCVMEDHTGEGREPGNSLVSIDLESGKTSVLASGRDFYSSPRLSPDGRRLAWLSWYHPNMPWDGVDLWVSSISPDGFAGPPRHVAGGEGESIFQPEWSPDGILYFVSDRTGWWNLYRYCDDRVEPLCKREAEFGRPQWVFGMSTYAFVSAERLICTFFQGEEWRLASLDTWTLDLTPIPTRYTDISQVRVARRRVVFCGGSPRESRSVVQLDLRSGRTEVLRRSSDLAVDPGHLSVPEPVEFRTEGGRTAHAYFYPPRNPDCEAPADALPPLLVKSHGGPTSATTSTLDLETQYWTSRGLAVLDVNYGGSSGYGRAYRERLNGQWGVVDVDDCVNGARYLVDRGSVDGARLAIRGGSAGGYTTLAALAFRDLFHAGASYYGVSDLEALATDTHKFESRYLDRLIGPYPDRKDLYQERSPLHFADRISCPVIFFQGLEDKVVPPDQAERMVEALREKGLAVAYVPFEGEQHGFRRAENIKRALDAELYFYSRIFGFELAEPVGTVTIENL